MIKSERIHELKGSSRKPGNVIYWMSRDQRMNDNWALLYGRMLAEKNLSEFAVVFCMSDKFLDATIRQYEFMIEGLKEVSQDLQLKNIPFYLLTGEPMIKLSKFINDYNVSHVVTDFDPLKIKQQWKNDLMKNADIHLMEVDTHNIVPARFVSDKPEFAAYTLRPKIHKNLEYFLEDFPDVQGQSNTGQFNIQQINWKDLTKKNLKIDRSVPPVNWLHPGEHSAKDIFEYFIQEKLNAYIENRNDPNKDALSNLSPYLHFGQISAQRIAFEIIKNKIRSDNSDAFLEELIIRKELSDNYCLYNPEYDNLSNLPDWANKTLQEHWDDEREYNYSTEEFEMAKTHDPLWNSAQKEMIETGKMHGYMRMYWAKKILEWTSDPEIAFKTAIYLNDKYELDGRDPNGYVGCAWAIAGVHDRAWQEREVYGKIRYMNANGAKRKFKIDSYIHKWGKDETI